MRAEAIVAEPRAPPPNGDAQGRRSCEGGERVRAELDRHERRCRSRPRRPRDGGQHRRLARSTLIFSVATGLSRVLGLVREMVAAYYFGINGKINAFTVAFQIPNLVRALLADAALSGAFVPVFSDLLEKGDRKRAWRVASTVFWLVLLVLGGLTALFILIAPLLIRPFGDPGGDFDLAVGLSRVLFPIVVLLGLSGVIVGILNTYDHFTVPALTPVFWNLAIIAGLVARRAARRQRGRGALRLRGRDPGRDPDPAVPARAVAARARRPASSSCSTGATRRCAGSSR